jgi:restriction system protein
MPRRLFLILFLAVSAQAQIPVGATRQEIINLIGWPASTSKGGEREILNYPDFTVTLEKDQMTSLHFKPGKKKPLSSYLLSAQKTAPDPQRVLPLQISNDSSTQPSGPRVAAPEEILGPNPNRVDSRPTLTTAPAQAVSRLRVIAPVPAKPPTDPFAQVKSRIGWMIGLFVGLAFLKIWLRKSQRSRRDAGDLFPPPPRKPPAGLAPLVIPRREERFKPDPIKDGWSLALLKELEWHRFEQVVAAYERELGNDAELTDFGPDGGIDIKVFEKGARTPIRVIQCKARDSQLIGVELVRAFYGAMTLEKGPQGAFYTTSGFTEAALAVGKTEPNLELVDGPTFLNRISRLQLSAQLKLFEIATEGDYTTPTCPSCGIKMVIRTAKTGRNAGSDFWACPKYRCGQIINIRRS